MQKPYLTLIPPVYSRHLSITLFLPHRRHHHPQCSDPHPTTMPPDLRSSSPSLFFSRCHARLHPPPALSKLEHQPCRTSLRRRQLSKHHHRMSCTTKEGHWIRSLERRCLGDERREPMIRYFSCSIAAIRLLIFSPTISSAVAISLKTSVVGSRVICLRLRGCHREITATAVVHH